MAAYEDLLFLLFLLFFSRLVGHSLSYSPVFYRRSRRRKRDPLQGRLWGRGRGGGRGREVGLSGKNGAGPEETWESDYSWQNLKS